MMMLLVTYIISTATVFLPAFVAQEAKEDSWLSVVFGTIFALIIVNISISLGLKYPDKTIIHYACDITGNIIGKVIGVSYVYMFALIAWAVTRELEDIFVIAFNPEAPILAIGIITILVATYAVFSGLEVIARLNELLLPLGIIVLFFIALLNIPNIKLSHLQPVLYNGIYPSLKGSMFILSWLVETLIILQIIPYVKEKERIRKYTNISLVFLGCSLMIGVLTIATFGVNLTSKFLFPALQYVRLASIGPYIQNLDVMIMMVWISGIFIKISLSYYLTATALSQVTNSKSHKNYIIPIGFIVIILSVASSRMLVEHLYFLKYILPFYFLVMTLVIPLILLLISALRKKF